MAQQKHQHGEAFCLMEYASKDGSHREFIWNSRDGVTPFCIGAEDGTAEMQHVNWQKDKRSPKHVPEIGDRVFVDVGPYEEDLRERIAKKVDEFWNAAQYPMSKHYETKEAAIEAMLDECLHEPRSPHLVVVDEKLHRRFKLRAERMMV